MIKRYFKPNRLILLTVYLFMNFISIFANEKNKITKRNNGIEFYSKDSTFSLNFRFRIQSRAGFTTISEKNFNSKEWEMRVRRLRFRVDGIILNPKLTYYIQMSFSRGDMDWSDVENSKINTAPNPIRDAMVFYKFNQHFNIGFGQGKLPGNRQRVNSSGELQFVDRSIVNSTFTIDRDFGLFLNFEQNFKKSIFIFKNAISSGEGRQNVVSNNPGLCYTSRLEVLPFGKFNNKGDYFEGDLEREKKPKISVAGGYSFNEGSVRTGGQLGKDLKKPYNINSILVDACIKYNGWAFNSEYINRKSNQPTLSSNNLDNFIYTGYGFNSQLSYYFKNKVELAVRYSSIDPDSKTNKIAKSQKDYWFGITKYLNAHKTKIQFNIIYTDKKELNNTYNSNYSFLFQIELGI